MRLFDRLFKSQAQTPEQIEARARQIYDQAAASARSLGQTEERIHSHGIAAAYRDLLDQVGKHRLVPPRPTENSANIETYFQELVPFLGLAPDRGRQAFAFYLAYLVFGYTSPDGALRLDDDINDGLQALIDSQGWGRVRPHLRLKPGWTRFLTDDGHFPRWHYRRDPTHVCFWQPATFQWLAREQGWELVMANNPVALLRRW